MQQVLSEEEFAALIDAGCPDCPGRQKLVVEAIVTQKLPLLEGELYGAPSWGYKGEDLVRGAFRVACASCKRELFAATACPRCAAEGGVARALEGTNAFPLPTKCGRCDSAQFVAHAFVPARVVYEGKRAIPARAQAAPEEPGFRAFRAECKGCRDVTELREPCPMCSQ